MSLEIYPNHLMHLRIKIFDIFKLQKLLNVCFFEIFKDLNEHQP
jgi:hypothetical protein